MTAAPDVKDPVPGSHGRQISDQAAASATAHQHDRADDQAGNALDTLMPASPALLAIGCRYDTLLHCRPAVMSSMT